jgi:3-hydroxybutyryl-CoA dehydrogenase
VIINSVEHTLQETHPGFIRMNGWASFLSSPLVEASGPDSYHDSAADVFALLGKEIQWVPDEPGFVTPRVISMIINEAYFTLEEGVSSEADIDTAMKLGTNYPYGPFEWAEKIGRQNVRNLLLKLSITHSRYRPSSLL